MRRYSIDSGEGRIPERLFEDQLVSAADFLYRNNMILATEDQRYNILIENGFPDDVAVIAVEDFGEVDS